MLNYIARRTLLAIPVLFGVVTISFFVTISVPGDPLAGLLPEDPTPEQYQKVASEFGLDQPVIVQWARYLSRTLQGDLGRSLRTRRPVIEDLRPALVATIELAMVAFMLTVVIGVPLGILAAVRENTRVDYLVSIFAIGGAAAPIFWTALMLQLLFFGRLDWLPAGGRIDQMTFLLQPFPQRTGFFLIDSLLAGDIGAFASASRHLVLPACVLAYRAIGLVVRITRATMLEMLRAPFIQAERAFGFSTRRIVNIYAAKNALPSILTVIGLSFGLLLQGSILVETVFNWPGLGLYTIQSVIRLDYTGIIAVSMLITLIYMFANLIIDLLYPIVDPRLRT